MSECGPVDPEAVLDALCTGRSARDVAELFGISQAEVRRIRKEAAARLTDGEELREQMALDCRRLLQSELAFGRQGLAELDPTLMIVSLKCNERRMSLLGAGASQPSHLLFSIEAKQQEVAETSTERLRRVLDQLRNDPTHKGPPQIEAEPGGD